MVIKLVRLDDESEATKESSVVHNDFLLVGKTLTCIASLISCYI